MANGGDLVEGERPVVMVTGQRVALGPVRRDLLPLYHRWANDLAIARTVEISRPTTLEQQAASYDGVVASERMVSFVIYEVGTWQPIGTTYLDGIDSRHRHAEFGIAIGEGDYRGKGYGAEVTQLMLDYAFTVLGLHNVMLVVYEFNLAGLHAYMKAGFREFGRRRQAHLMGGRLWDVIYMECLSTEFTGSVLGDIFAQDPPRA